MKEIILTLILGMGVLIASKQDKNYIVRPVYSVDSIEVLKAGNNEIQLKTISTVPNPCYQFSHIEIDETKKAENQILVNVFAKIDKNVNCISIIGKMEAVIKVPVSGVGVYKIIFVGKTKNHEISVNVK
jgi:hypothetical protein